MLATACFAAAPATRTLSLAGTLTNTTADVTGPATLELALQGETATATLKASAPLVGNGKLTGNFRQGWLELRGRLDEGFDIQLRGALNARDYRGTYIAAVPGTPVQYGKFELTLQSR